MGVSTGSKKDAGGFNAVPVPEGKKEEKGGGATSLSLYSPQHSPLVLYPQVAPHHNLRMPTMRPFFSAGLAQIIMWLGSSPLWAGSTMNEKIGIFETKLDSQDKTTPALSLSLSLYPHCSAPPHSPF